MVKRKVTVVLEPVKELSSVEKLEIQTQFLAAVETNDVEKVAYALHKHHDLVSGTSSLENATIDEIKDNANSSSRDMVSDESMLSSFTKAITLMENWKQTIGEGDIVDVYREAEFVWYTAKITKKVGDVISLHYNGWAAKYDDHGFSFADLSMYPCGTAVKQKKKTIVKKPKAVHYEILQVNVEAETAAAAAAATAGTDRLGRRERAARVTTPAETHPKRATVKRTKTKEEEDEEDSLLREWVCCVCSQLEASDGSVLILCDGLCKRSFHLMCLNLSEVR